MILDTLDSTTLPYGIPIIILFSTVLLYQLSASVRQYYKLSHVPGPFLAGCSGLWLVLKFRQKESFPAISRKLHRKYGSVIRYGPKNVLFADPSALPVIYATTKPFIKAESYEPAINLVNSRLVSSFVTTRDEATVSAIKKNINSAFSAGAVLEYEPHVDAAIQTLSDHLKSNGPDIDMVRSVSLCTFDAICRIAFSKATVTEDEMRSVLHGGRERFAHWHHWFTLPILERLIYKNTLLKGIAPVSLLGQKASDIVQERISDDSQKTHNDLLHCFLQARTEAPSVFGTDTVVGLVMSVIHAGFETTSATVTYSMFHILRSPRICGKLRKELESAGLESPPTYRSISKLPYLDASIKEAMRLHPLAADPLEREVPASGATIAGVYIPGGTAVAVNAQHLGRIPEIWGDDYEEYRPERWLEANDVSRAKMERASLVFGAGKRMCLGQHIAWLEVRKIVAYLVLNFEFELLEPEKMAVTEEYLALPVRLPVRARSLA